VIETPIIVLWCEINGESNLSYHTALLMRCSDLKPFHSLTRRTFAIQILLAYKHFRTLNSQILNI